MEHDVVIRNDAINLSETLHSVHTPLAESLPESLNDNHSSHRGRSEEEKEDDTSLHSMQSSKNIICDVVGSISSNSSIEEKCPQNLYSCGDSIQDQNDADNGAELNFASDVTMEGFKISVDLPDLVVSDDNKILTPSAMAVIKEINVTPLVPDSTTCMDKIPSGNLMKISDENKNEIPYGMEDYEGSENSTSSAIVNNSSQYVTSCGMAACHDNNSVIPFGVTVSDDINTDNTSSGMPIRDNICAGTSCEKIVRDEINNSIPSGTRIDNDISDEIISGIKDNERTDTISSGKIASYIRENDTSCNMAYSCANKDEMEGGYINENVTTSYSAVTVSRDNEMLHKIKVSDESKGSTLLCVGVSDVIKDPYFSEMTVSIDNKSAAPSEMSASDDRKDGSPSVIEVNNADMEEPSSSMAFSDDRNHEAPLATEVSDVMNGNTPTGMKGSYNYKGTSLSCIVEGYDSKDVIPSMITVDDAGVGPTPSLVVVTDVRDAGKSVAPSVMANTKNHKDLTSSGMAVSDDNKGSITSDTTVGIVCKDVYSSCMAILDVAPSKAGVGDARKNTIPLRFTVSDANNDVTQCDTTVSDERYYAFSSGAMTSDDSKDITPSVMEVDKASKVSIAFDMTTSDNSQDPSSSGAIDVDVSKDTNPLGLEVGHHHIGEVPFVMTDTDDIKDACSSSGMVDGVSKDITPSGVNVNNNCMDETSFSVTHSDHSKDASSTGAIVDGVTKDITPLCMEVDNDHKDETPLDMAVGDDKHASLSCIVDSDVSREISPSGMEVCHGFNDGIDLRTIVNDSSKGVSSSGAMVVDANKDLIPSEIELGSHFKDETPSNLIVTDDSKDAFLSGVMVTDPCKDIIPSDMEVASDCIDETPGIIISDGAPSNLKVGNDGKDKTLLCMAASDDNKSSPSSTMVSNVNKDLSFSDIEIANDSKDETHSDMTVGDYRKDFSSSGVMVSDGSKDMTHSVVEVYNDSKDEITLGVPVFDDGMDVSFSGTTGSNASRNITQSDMAAGSDCNVKFFSSTRFGDDSKNLATSSVELSDSRKYFTPSDMSVIDSSMDITHSGMNVSDNDQNISNCVMSIIDHMTDMISSDSSRNNYYEPVFVSGVGVSDFGAIDHIHQVISPNLLVNDNTECSFNRESLADNSNFSNFDSNLTDESMDRNRNREPPSKEDVGSNVNGLEVLISTDCTDKINKRRFILKSNGEEIVMKKVKIELKDCTFGMPYNASITSSNESIPKRTRQSLRVRNNEVQDISSSEDKVPSGKYSDKSVIGEEEIIDDVLLNSKRKHKRVSYAEIGDKDSELILLFEGSDRSPMKKVCGGETRAWVENTNPILKKGNPTSFGEECMQNKQNMCTDLKDMKMVIKLTKIDDLSYGSEDCKKGGSIKDSKPPALKPLPGPEGDKFTEVDPHKDCEPPALKSLTGSKDINKQGGTRNLSRNHESAEDMIQKQCSSIDGKYKRKEIVSLSTTNKKWLGEKKVNLEGGEKENYGEKNDSSPLVKKQTGVSLSKENFNQGDNIDTIRLKTPNEEINFQKLLSSVNVANNLREKSNMKTKSDAKNYIKKSITPGKGNGQLNDKLNKTVNLKKSKEIALQHGGSMLQNTHDMPVKMVRKRESMKTGVMKKGTKIVKNIDSVLDHLEKYPCTSMITEKNGRKNVNTNIADSAIGLRLRNKESDLQKRENVLRNSIAIPKLDRSIEKKVNVELAKKQIKTCISKHSRNIIENKTKKQNYVNIENSSRTEDARRRGFQSLLSTTGEKKNEANSFTAIIDRGMSQGSTVDNDTVMEAATPKEDKSYCWKKVIWKQNSYTEVLTPKRSIEDICNSTGTSDQSPLSQYKVISTPDIICIEAFSDEDTTVKSDNRFARESLVDTGSLCKPVTQEGTAKSDDDFEADVICSRKGKLSVRAKHESVSSPIIRMISSRKNTKKRDSNETYESFVNNTELSKFTDSKPTSADSNVAKAELSKSIDNHPPSQKRILPRRKQKKPPRYRYDDEELYEPLDDTYIPVEEGDETDPYNDDDEPYNPYIDNPRAWKSDDILPPKRTPLPRSGVKVQPKHTENDDDGSDSSIEIVNVVRRSKYKKKDHNSYISRHEDKKQEELLSTSIFNSHKAVNEDKKQEEMMSKSTHNNDMDRNENKEQEEGAMKSTVTKNYSPKKPKKVTTDSDNDISAEESRKRRLMDMRKIVELKNKTTTSKSVGNKGKQKSHVGRNSHRKKKNKVQEKPE